MNNDIHIRQNDDDASKLTFTNADGTPLDLTGWELYFRVQVEQEGNDDENILFTITPVVDDPTTGIAVVPYTAEQTNQDINSYYYYLRRKDASGKFKTILTSDFYIDVNTNVGQ